jgi:hypothetical protein
MYPLGIAGGGRCCWDQLRGRVIGDGEARKREPEEVRVLLLPAWIASGGKDQSLKVGRVQERGSLS